jgi:hypothetical protein
MYFASPSDGSSGMGRDRSALLKKTPERAEYTTESEVEETELEQTRHNLRCNVLRASAYSDSRLDDVELSMIHLMPVHRCLHTVFYKTCM